MGDIFAFVLATFTGFFAITNPIANTPVFLGLMEGQDGQTHRQVARKATTTAFAIVAAFTLLGKWIFSLFDLTIPAFRIAGGILIFYVGFEMLLSKPSSVHSTSHTPQDLDALSISPLAIPIIAGPGTIVTAMNFVTGKSFLYLIITILMAGVMFLLNYLAFAYSDLLTKRLGNSAIAVIGKLMGLILTIIGVEMVTKGFGLTLG